MKTISEGVVAASQPNSNRQSAIFPGICVLPSGRWLCGYRAAPLKSATTHQSALLCISDDEGQSWSAPVEPFTAPEIDGVFGNIRGFYCTSLGGDEVLATMSWMDASDPALPFFNKETQGILDMKVLLSRSHDGGDTWSLPELTNTAPYTMPIAVTGPTLVLPNGEWACQFEVNKLHDDHETVWRHSSVFMFSKDEGKTWPEYSAASSDPDNRVFYWDQRPQVAPDGEIFDMFWTYDNGSGKYLDIHSRRSRNNGRDWGEMRDLGIAGQPAPPVFLPDGRIALVYMDRETQPTLKVRVSEDSGLSWPAESEGILHRMEAPTQTEEKSSMQDAWNEMGKFSMGLPSTALLPNGDFLVVFYLGAHTDATDIRWMRVRV